MFTNGSSTTTKESPNKITKLQNIEPDLFHVNNESNNILDEIPPNPPPNLNTYNATHNTFYIPPNSNISPPTDVTTEKLELYRELSRLQKEKEQQANEIRELQVKNMNPCILFSLFLLCISFSLHSTLKHYFQVCH